MNDLHWSVDYTDQTDHWGVRSELAQPLAQALSSTPVDPDATSKTHRYTILPNFWCGFNRGHSPDFGIGSLVIERTRTEADWRYHVTHENTPSGERLILDFTCGDEPLRPLRSPLAHPGTQQRRWYLQRSRLAGIARGIDDFTHNPTRTLVRRR